MKGYIRLFLGGLICLIVNNAISTETGRPLVNDPTRSPVGCTQINFMGYENDFYGIYQCHSTKTKEGYFLFKRETDDNLVEEVRLPWREYPLNSLGFGYCRPLKESKKVIRAILPINRSADGFVSLDKVLTAWEIEEISRKMRLVPKSDIRDCFFEN